jgi:hypothetical protein
MLTPSLHFAKISLHFPKMQGETGWHQTASSANIVIGFQLLA